MTYGSLNPTGFAALVAILGLSYAVPTVRARVQQLRDRVRDWHQPDPLDQLQADFAEDRIDHDEFKRRVDAHLTADDEYTREKLSDVPNIGPTIAAELALRFESVEHVRQARRDELTDVPDVGPQRAEAIRAYFEGGRRE